MRKYIGVAITKDFQRVDNALDVLCAKKYLDRSRIIREAIRKEVQELLKQYPDVADNLSDKGVYFITEFLEHSILINTPIPN